MLPYTDAEKNVIKSNLHVGDNRPLAEVVVENMPSGQYDFETKSTAIKPHDGYADYHPSCVQLSDGRILYMYSRGEAPGALYQSIIADADTFVSGDNTVTSETTVLENIYYPRATVFRNETGDLFFIAAYTKTTTENVAKVLVYKSALRDGSDWELYSTIQSVSWGGANSFSSPRRLSVGIPLFDNGKIFLSHLFFYNDSGYLCAKLAISSTEDCLIWTQRYIVSAGAFDANMNFGSRNIGKINGVFWWSWYSDYGSIQIRFASSYDGISWDEAFLESSGYPLNTIFYDTKKLYSLSIDQNLPSHLYQTSTSPSTFSDFSDPGITLPIGENTNFDPHTCIIKLGSVAAVMSGSMTDGSGCYIAGYIISNATIPVQSINVEPIKNGAGSASLEIDNTGGVFSPDKSGPWQNIIFPNSEISILMGYGENREKVFGGLIDSIEEKTYPPTISVSARDMMKLALDQTITNAITYTSVSLEYALSDLASRAGFATIHAEASGLTISVTFVNVSYADAMQTLCQAFNYEFFAGREGEIWFNYVTDRQPEQEDAIVLSGTTPTELTKYPIVTDSIQVWSGTGKTGTEYVKDTDYTITEGGKDTPWTITRISGGAISDGATVYVSYVYAAWVFEEGKDIFSLGYTINDASLYRTIVVKGTAADGSAVSGSANYANADYYNLPSNKILVVDDSTAKTTEQCEAAALRNVVTAGATARKVDFVAVGNPYLWVGDCIMVVESSTTISEIYRVESISHSFSADGSPIFSTNITAYHYGYAPA